MHGSHSGWPWLERVTIGNPRCKNKKREIWGRHLLTWEHETLPEQLERTRIYLMGHNTSWTNANRLPLPVVLWNSCRTESKAKSCMSLQNTGRSGSTNLINDESPTPTLNQRLEGICTLRPWDSSQTNLWFSSTTKNRFSAEQSVTASFICGKSQGEKQKPDTHLYLKLQPKILES